MRYDKLFENDDLIIINKPSGLLSIPGRDGKDVSLQSILQEKHNSIFIVHRLDKATSGVIAFAKNEKTHKQLSQLFEERQTEKIYSGLVHGHVTPLTGKIDEAIMPHSSGNGKMLIDVKGKPSLTEYQVLENFKLFSWVRFKIHSGRTHQIRVHAQHMGHSIVCDELYGSPEPVYVSSLKRNYHLSKKDDEERPILSRLALHAASLRFILNDKEYFFEAALPKDMKALLQQLRKLNA